MEEGSRRAVIPHVVREEILLALLFMPCYVIDLVADYSTRLEMSDASPGGHGRAYTTVDESTMSELCRLSEGKGVYTSLSLEGSLVMDEKGKCPLQQLDLDPGLYRWHLIPKPGGFSTLPLRRGCFHLVFALSASTHK